MAVDLRNLIATGIQAGNRVNPVLAAFGKDALELYGIRPFAALVGRTASSPSDTLLTTNGLVKTVSGTGASAAMSYAVNPAGLLLTTGTDNSGLAQAQEASMDATTAAPKYKPSATHPILFYAVVTPTTMAGATNAVWIGLNEVDTSIFASGVYACNSGIGFLKAAGAATFVGQINKTNASTKTSTSSLGSFVASTALYLGMRILTTRVDFFVNGVQRAQTTVTNMPATIMAPTFAACNAVDGTTSGVFKISEACCFQDIR